MKIKTYCIIFFTAIFLAASCKLTSTPSDSTENNGTTNEENSSLFKQKDDGSYVFTTNDTKYISKNGYTLWTIIRKIASTESFSGFTTTLVKSQGNTGYGFGVIFNENTDSKGNSSMIAVMIRTTGDYAIGKIENGLYSDIQYWTQNKYIKTGLGSKNSITIRKDAASDEYAVTFNGDSDSTVKFSDTGSYIYSNGNRGYVVVLAPNENFPVNRVAVSFAGE
jgi:hypothetical protein